MPVHVRFHVSVPKRLVERDGTGQRPVVAGVPFLHLDPDLTVPDGRAACYEDRRAAKQVPKWVAEFGGEVVYVSMLVTLSSFEANHIVAGHYEVDGAVAEVGFVQKSGDSIIGLPAVGYEYWAAQVSVSGPDLEVVWRLYNAISAGDRSYLVGGPRGLSPHEHFLRQLELYQLKCQVLELEAAARAAQKE